MKRKIFTTLSRRYTQMMSGSKYGIRGLQGCDKHGDVMEYMFSIWFVIHDTVYS